MAGAERERGISRLQDGQRWRRAEGEVLRSRLRDAHAGLHGYPVGRADPHSAEPATWLPVAAAHRSEYGGKLDLLGRQRLHPADHGASRLVRSELYEQLR